MGSTHYSGSRKTKFLVHGFTHHGHRQWLLNLATALLNKEDLNVIIVDWGHGAGIPYAQATANTRVVGALIAQLIKELTLVGPSLADFHIIGHSLGAHIAGYAGERLHTLGQITGLDPADPYFQGTDVRVRLDPSDADFVDVIHTDGSSILQLGFGTMQQMGHVDFYPNGGAHQPGCDADFMGTLSHTVWAAVTQLDTLAAEGAVACSHERSYILYTDSVSNNCPYTAYPCTSGSEYAAGHCLSCTGTGCSEMGYNSKNFSARGSFYLDTASISPFCEFHYQVNITGRNNMDGVITLVLQGTNGRSANIPLMADNEVHTKGHIISKFIKVPNDIGTLTNIALEYDKTSSVLTGWAYPDDWQLMGVSIFSAEEQRMYTFCAYGKTLTSHKPIAMGLTGTC